MVTLFNLNLIKTFNYKNKKKNERERERDSPGDLPGNTSLMGAT